MTIQEKINKVIPESHEEKLFIAPMHYEVYSAISVARQIVSFLSANSLRSAELEVVHEVDEDGVSMTS